MKRSGSIPSPRTTCAGILFGALLLALLPGCGESPEAAADGIPTLRLTTTRLRGFDPANAADESSIRATGLVYEGLLQYAYWDRPYRVEPSLADLQRVMAEYHNG